MTTLWQIMASLGLVSLISLVGAVYLLWQQKRVERWMPIMVGFATGALLAVSFFDLVPESFKLLGNNASPYILGGLLLFLFFEQVLHLHHEHREECEDCEPKRITGYSILLVDGMHNFLDGVLVASAFMASPALGVATTVAVIVHEIPQELGDYAVLVHSGFKSTRALGWNLISALVAIVGGLFAFYFLSSAEKLIPYFVGVGAGGLMYIALVDLLGEIRAHGKSSERWAQMLAMMVGLILVVVITRLYAGG
jgi:zinc and cadmium transporter